MQKSLLFLIFSFFIINTTLGQNQKYIYEVIVTEDPFNLSYKMQYPSQYEKYMIRYDSLNGTQFELILSNEYSVFQIMESDYTNKNPITLPLIYGHKRFVNINDNKTYEIFNFWNNDLIIYKENEYYNWSKAKKNVTINDQLCDIFMCTFFETINGNKRKYSLTAYSLVNSDSNIRPLGIIGLPGKIIRLDINHLSYVLVNEEETDDIISLSEDWNSEISQEQFEAISSQLIRKEKSRILNKN